VLTESPVVAIDNPSVTAATAEGSFIRGGPFYRAQQAARLIRPNQWNLGRRITFFIAVGWLPLLLLTALLNHEGLISLIKDYRVYSRTLIAIPVLLVGEVLMDSRFRAVLSQIRQAGLLDPPDLIYMDKVIGALIRLRDSLLPELLIVLLLIVHTTTSFKGMVDTTPWLSSGVGPDFHLTAAGWYAVVVSASIFQFLLGLGIWKWLLWTFLAYKLSGRNLKLVPTHPDEHGGLGFLGLTAAAFAPVAFAVTTVIGATWREEVLHAGAHLMDFKLAAIVLVVIIALVALGPLIFFVPKLAALRRRGILEYGILSQMNSTNFHEKWIQHRAGHEAEFLQAPESSTLYDFGRSYERIEQLRPFPADRGALITLAAAVAIPALPLVLSQIPLALVLKVLLKALR
jgi:hypothetical protein